MEFPKFETVSDFIGALEENLSSYQKTVNDHVIRFVSIRDEETEEQFQNAMNLAFCFGTSFKDVRIKSSNKVKKKECWDVTLTNDECTLIIIFIKNERGVNSIFLFQDATKNEVKRAFSVCNSLMKEVIFQWKNKLKKLFGANI